MHQIEDNKSHIFLQYTNVLKVSEDDIYYLEDSDEWSENVESRGLLFFTTASHSNVWSAG